MEKGQVRGVGNVQEPEFSDQGRGHLACRGLWEPCTVSVSELVPNSIHVWVFYFGAQSWNMEFFLARTSKIRGEFEGLG